MPNRSAGAPRRVHEAGIAPPAQLRPLQGIRVVARDGAEKRVDLGIRPRERPAEDGGNHGHVES